MGNPFQKVWQLIASASHSRTFGLLAILVIIAAIPLTVLVAQRQQELRQKATGSTCTLPNAPDVGNCYTNCMQTLHPDLIQSIRNDTSNQSCSDGEILGFWCFGGGNGNGGMINDCSVKKAECDADTTFHCSITPTPIVSLTPVTQSHEIHGTVWEDTNSNGRVDGSEQGKSGVTITLSGGPTTKPPETTAASGQYFFRELALGTYTVAITPDGFSIVSGTGGTTPSKTVTISASNTFEDVSWGIKSSTSTQPCALTSASWSASGGKTTVPANEIVKLIVQSTGNCDGKEVTYEVRRNGLPIIGDIPASNQPSPSTITSADISSSWTAEYNPQNQGTNTDWYFKATLAGGSTITSSDPKLSVSPGVGGTNPTVNFGSLSPGNNATVNTTSVTLSGSITDTLPASQQRKVYLVMSHDNGLHEDAPVEVTTYTGQTKSVSKSVTLSPGVHLWEFYVETGVNRDRYHSGWNKFSIVLPNVKYKITGTVKVRSESGIYTSFTGSARVDITGPTNHLNIPVTNGSYTTPEDLNPGLYVITLDDITNYIINPPNPTQLEIWGKTNEDTTADFVITAQTDSNNPITFGDGTPPDNALTGKRVTFVRIINDTSGSAYGRNVEVLITPQGGTESVLSGSGITYTRMNLTSNAYTYSYPHGQDFEEGKTYSWKVRVTHAGQAYTSSALSFNVNSITESGNITFSQFTPTNRETKTNPVLLKVRINDTNNLTGERSVKFYTNQNLFTPILINEFKYTKTGAGNDQEFSFTKYDLVAGHYWWYAIVDIPSRMQGYGSAWQEFNVTGGTVPSPSTTASPTPSPKPGCPVAGHYCSVGSTCQDSRFEPDNKYICGDGKTQTCCILKGNPTPPTCFGCQSVDTWNVCVDDNKKCTSGQICKSGICQSAALPTTPVLPTKPGGATPTSVPTATNVPTTTGGVTSTAVPTATGGGTGTAKIALTLKLQAIGKNVNPDSQHPTTRENPDPKTPTRELKVEIFNAQNTKVTEGTGNVTYDSASGLFKGTVDVSNLTTGDYSVKVKTNKYLRRLIGKETNKVIQHIVAGPTPNQMPESSLVVGDINNDNNLNIDDYNVYYNCWGPRGGSSTCSDPSRIDLNDDGVIDSRTVLNDYAWLFYSFEVQEGD